HVHLDGALDLLPDHRAAGIREHLSRCEDCQARLEEERRIREQASEILGGAVAGAAASVLPSFDRVRERAAGGEPGTTESGASPAADSAGRGHPPGPSTESSARSRESWYRGLAWAATVVLSLGIGWYARSGVVEPEVRSRPTLTGPSSPAEADAAPGQPSAPAASALGRTAENVTGNEEEAGGAAGRQGSAEPDGPAESPAATLEAGGQERPDEARVAARDDRTDPAAATVSPMSFTGADGAARVEGSLAVPGLPVVSVAWNDADEGERAVTVVQRLPSGSPLTLRYTALAAGTPSQSEQPTPGAAGDLPARLEADGLDQAPEEARPAPGDSASLGSGFVTLRHGPWLLEATAPIERDSLREVLDRLPALP
ncbi:MAG: hypothetical protein R3223_08820, partial [Longimicrobiales bacterium]|nr:hypothetical protein [Longimicrobiales bacterium]